MRQKSNIISANYDLVIKINGAAIFQNVGFYIKVLPGNPIIPATCVFEILSTESFQKKQTMAGAVTRATCRARRYSPPPL